MLTIMEDGRGSSRATSIEAVKTISTISSPSPFNDNSGSDAKKKQTSILRSDKDVKASKSNDPPTESWSLTQLIGFLCGDHNSARLATIAFSFACSFIGALLLVIVGEPPSMEGSLYQYSDLMRLATDIHRQTITLTPEVVDSPSSWSSTTPDNTITPVAQMQDATTEGRWTRLLHRWWPIKPLELSTENALLDDANFYSRNYRTFQTCFLILIVGGDLALLAAWIGFTISRRMTERAHGLNSHSTSPVADESDASLTVKIFKCFAPSPGECPLRRSIGLALFILALIHATLLFLLLARPSLFTLIAHEVTFSILALAVVATTRLGHQAPVMFKSTRAAQVSFHRSSKLESHFQRCDSISKHPSLAPPTPVPTPASLVVAAATSTPTSNSSDTYPASVNPFEEAEDAESMPEPGDRRTINTTTISIIHSTSSEAQEPIDEMAEREVERRV